MISTIKFERGVKTCAVEPGKFCHWRGTTGSGMKYVCTLFENEPLHDKDGWLQRCKQCVEQFGVGE